jgi:hypothetical protein
MPVTVRNQSNTVVVLSSRDMKGDSIEWGRAGDQNGEDVQQVPEDFLQKAPFLRSVALGILAIEADDEALKEAIAKQAARYRGAQTSQDAIADLVESGTAGKEIRISEADIDAHIAALSKSQDSTLSDIQGPTDSVQVGDRTSPVLTEDTFT